MVVRLGKGNNVLTEERMKVLQDLWDEGYCVVVFNPDEIGDDVEPDDLMSFMIKSGWEYIWRESPSTQLIDLK